MKQSVRGNIPPDNTSIYCLFSLLLLLAISLCLISPPRVHADGGAPDLAYVAGASQGIGIINVAQQKLTAHFAVTGDPHTILLSPDGRLLYVTQAASGRVIILAAKTGQTICNAQFPGHPSLLALSTDGTTLYVAGTNETPIIAIDAQTCQLQHSFQNAEPVSWLATTSATQGNALTTQLWVAGASSVVILDAQWQVSGSISIPGTPRFLSLPNNLTAYVATRQGTIYAIDMLTDQIFASLPLGGTFGPMDYDAITQDIYIPDMQHNQIDVLAPFLNGSGSAPSEPERIIHLNGSPQSIAITNDGQLGFVALSSGQVAMLDIPGHNLIATISVGGQPHFIITGPFPSAATAAPLQQNTHTPDLPVLVVISILALGGLASIAWIVWQQRKKWWGR